MAEIILLIYNVSYVPYDNTTDLCKKFFSSSTWLHIMQCIVGILDHAVPKGTQAKLHHGPVVKNLEGTRKNTHH